jgi:hypothetical protein
MCPSYRRLRCITVAWFQAIAAKSMKTAFFCVNTQRVAWISYRCFGTTNWPLSSCFKNFIFGSLHPEVWTDRLSRKKKEVTTSCCVLTHKSTAAGCPRYFLFALSICGEKELGYSRFAPSVGVYLSSYYFYCTFLSLRYETLHKNYLMTPKPSSFTYQMDAPGANEKTSGHVKKALFLG